MTQAVVLILSFSIRHSLSQNAVEDLLQLLRIFLPTMISGNIFQSYFKFNQFVPKPKQRNRFVYFCPDASCGSIVKEANRDDNNVNDDQRNLCEFCSTPYTIRELKKDGKFFIMLSIDSQITAILNVHGNKLRTLDSRTVLQTGVYKETLALHNPNNISLTWNVDGVPLFSSSSNEVWPIRCIINELPHLLGRQNIILAGLYFGKGKPNMTSFMECFVESVQQVNKEGICWKNPHNAQFSVSRIFPNVSSCDAVARCMVQCIHQFNGDFGCSWCIQKGTRVHKGDGYVNTYPKTNEPLRTHDQMLDFGKRVTEDRELVHHMGVNLFPLCS